MTRRFAKEFNPVPVGTVCLELPDLAFGIRLEQDGPDDFRVVYGKQIDERLNYENAAQRLGEAIMHALACDARLDNSTPGEEDR